MKTREEAVAFIRSQFDAPVDAGPDRTNLTATRRPKGYAWHYGRQELRELLDFIYESPPNGPGQEVALR